MATTERSPDGGILPLRVSIPTFPYDRWPSVDAMAEAVSVGDRLGYYAVSFPEHIIMPVTDKPPGAVVWYDTFVLAATLAAATSRIRLLFHACVVPYRHPVNLAKMISTLDVVSKGRVVLLAGTGWMRREFHILGIPFEDRGARTDDALRAMKTLWTQPQPSYEGTFFSFPPVHFFPKCVQEPHVPIWVGGNGPRPVRRAVELGDGWIPLGGTFEDAAKGIAVLRERLEEAGRDPATFTFGYLLPFGEPDADHHAAAVLHARGRAVTEARTRGVHETIDRIGEYRAAGINHVVLQFNWRSPADYMERLEQFASEVLAPLQPAG